MHTQTLTPDLLRKMDAYWRAANYLSLVVACVVGDGEAETGPLATAWHSNKFLDPATDGVVLPILHLNGDKIANPTILARITREELEQLLRGYGWTPHFVEGHEPGLMHEAMAATLDTAVEQIRQIQHHARTGGSTTRPRWPMIVLDSPKGWTGPKVVDGLQVEGTFRSHQVPLHPATHPDHLELLEDWLRSYRPEELFDEGGRLKPELSDLAPKGERRMGANPHANGGMLLRDLRMPDFRDHAVAVPSPGVIGIGDTHVLGRFLRDVTTLNMEQRNFRVFGPDETLSNGLEALHLRLPCLPVVDPPADLPPHQPRQHPRPRLQGGGHHHHALRHDRAERSGPLPPRDGHHRPPAADRRQGRVPEAAAQGQAHRAQAVHRHTRRRPAGNPQLAMEGIARMTAAPKAGL